MTWRVDIQYRSGDFTFVHTQHVPGPLAERGEDAAQIALAQAALEVRWDEVLDYLVARVEEPRAPG